MSRDIETGRFFFHKIWDAIAHKKWKRVLIIIALFAAFIVVLWIAQQLGIANYSAGG
jgi:hypothetical protein